MCYYVLQETVCGASGCGCIFLAIALRGFCNDPQKPRSSTELCRGGNAFYYWIQGPYSSNGIRPRGGCPSCIDPDCFGLMPPKINIQTAPKIEGSSKENYEAENEWTIQVPFNNPTGNDLDSFARHKLAYQKACFGGLPAMSWVWHDQIDQAEVDFEAKRIHYCVGTGDFDDGKKESEELCPYLAKIDDLDDMFEPSSSSRARQSDGEVIDEEMVFINADSPAVQQIFSEQPPRYLPSESPSRS